MRSTSCTAPSRARRRSRTTACSRGGSSSAACASSSSITAAGTRTAHPSARTSSRSCRVSAGRPTGRSTALLTDLKQRGLLDETLVVWGGEFGRTPMNEARNGSKFLGRDHHPRAFTMWLAGGGIKPGVTIGEHRRARLQRRRRPGRRPRPARDDAAPARPRSREADLSLPGPRLPPDRRARARWSASCWREPSSAHARRQSDRLGRPRMPLSAHVRRAVCLAADLVLLSSRADGRTAAARRRSVRRSGRSIPRRSSHGRPAAGCDWSTVSIGRRKQRCGELTCRSRSPSSQ